MYQLIIVVHVLLGLGVIGLVLMQQGKGADAGAAFAGGGSGSVFGAQGAASFLSRTTAILAALFFATSLGLAVLSGHTNKASDLMDEPAIEKPLEDVPLIGEGQPVADSVPVVDTPVVDTTNIEKTQAPATNEAPVEEASAPVDEEAAQPVDAINETAQPAVTTTEKITPAVEEAPGSDIAEETVTPEPAVEEAPATDAANAPQ